MYGPRPRTCPSRPAPFISVFNLPSLRHKNRGIHPFRRLNRISDGIRTPGNGRTDGGPRRAYCRHRSRATPAPGPCRPVGRPSRWGGRHSPISTACHPLVSSILSKTGGLLTFGFSGVYVNSSPASNDGPSGPTRFRSLDTTGPPRSPARPCPHLTRTRLHSGPAGSTRHHVRGCSPQRLSTEIDHGAKVGKYS